MERSICYVKMTEVEQPDSHQNQYELSCYIIIFTRFLCWWSLKFTQFLFIKLSRGTYCLATAFRPAPPVQWIPATPRGVKRPGLEAYHPLPSSAQVKNSWNCTTTPAIRIHITQLDSLSFEGWYTWLPPSLTLPRVLCVASPWLIACTFGSR